MNVKKEKVQYCSKKEMMAELIHYKETGIITEHLGKMFIDIATKLANRSSYYNYTEKQDWIGDIILRMVEQIDKFDVTHPKANPFGYFSLLADRKMWSSIKKLKKNLNLKNELTECLIDELELNPKIHNSKTLRESVHLLD